MEFEIAIEMQKICTGEKRELTRGQIASETINLKSLTKGFKPELAEKCTAFYNEMIKTGEKKLYDIDMLLEETESIKTEFDTFIKNNKADDIFCRLYDDIWEFFRVPPFEGLDNIEYGVHEVCVFSVLEYFTWKTLTNHDHEKCRAEYRDNIAYRTYEEVGDKWIKVYDDLQSRYEKVEGNIDDQYGLKVKLTACCIIAVTAVRDQDSFVLDMAQAGVAEKAKKIVDAREDETYKEGESSLTDNAVRLFDFVYSQIMENKKDIMMKTSLYEDLIYEILAVVEEIPEGCVATYGQIAGLIGREKNSRLVGKVLAMAEMYGEYPCHRVVNHAGRLVPGWQRQRELLIREGVPMKDEFHADIKRCRWNESK